jgi:hypothetical protein
MVGARVNTYGVLGPLRTSRFVTVVSLDMSGIRRSDLSWLDVRT